MHSSPLSSLYSRLGSRRPTEWMSARSWELFQAPSPTDSVRPYIWQMKKPAPIRSDMVSASMEAAPQVSTLRLPRRSRRPRSTSRWMVCSSTGTTAMTSLSIAARSR